MFLKDFTRSSRFTPVLDRFLAPVTCGLAAGTLVETGSGWQSVESLAPGDRVQTLDGGLARVAAVDRQWLRPETEMPLIHLPGGSFDACSDMTLLPGQHLVMDTLDDPALGGAPFVLVPAMALCGLEGVTRAPCRDRIEVITPLFADEEAIYAHSGVLLHCPGRADGAGRYPENSFFPCLDRAAARAFLLTRAARLAG